MCACVDHDIAVVTLILDKRGYYICFEGDVIFDTKIDTIIKMRGPH